MTPAAPRTYYVGTSRKTRRSSAALAIVIVLGLLLGGAKLAFSLLSGPVDASGSSVSQDAVAQVKKYGNGQIPVDQLKSMGDGYELIPAAAEQFAALRTALESAGHTTTVNSAYRDVATQEELIEKYGLLEDGGRAAPVGESEHGWGISVDLTLDYEALQWMQANAPTYGFEATIADEPWHWTFVQ